jgi:hypothetical protein
MLATTFRTVSMTLPTTDHSGMTRLDCTGCGCDLALHMPDPMRPLRMLATCDGCGLWFLVDAVADKPEVVMVRLPEYGSIWATMSN